GVDLPAANLADHWNSRSLPAVFGDIAALPFPDRSFDLVLAIEVLEHVPRPSDALHEIARVAKGDVVLSVPREPLWRVANMARGRYLSAYGNTPGHIQHWSRRAFVRLVARHLDVTAVRSPPPWTIVAAHAGHPARAHAGAGVQG
ncbi:MAG: class I SAM-dependent methyltransferase, partial [Acidimicrobiia bacterium]